ncbi:MAG: hypothetical protein ACREHD_04480, partial [Pirellulales bacterium]
ARGKPGKKWPKAAERRRRARHDVPSPLRGGARYCQSFRGLAPTAKLHAPLPGRKKQDDIFRWRLLSTNSGTTFL